MILLIALFCNITVAEKTEQQNYIIKIIDTNNESISGAKITINGTNEVFYSNANGECKIPSHLINKENSINIDFISYKSKNIEITSKISKIILHNR